jgi:hypothetical protein
MVSLQNGLQSNVEKHFKNPTNQLTHNNRKLLLDLLHVVKWCRGDLMSGVRYGRRKG